MKHQPFYSVRPLCPAYPEPADYSAAQKRWIVVQGNAVFYCSGSGSGTVLMPDPLPDIYASSPPVYLGIRDDCIYHAVEIPASATPPADWILSPVRELDGKVPGIEMAFSAYAVRMVDYEMSNAFCGRCGARTRPLNTERARICNECNQIIYPRISPAIIVLIKRGDEILLARSPRFPPGVYSVIAGFNEPGENLEVTIHREVGEEVGIKVHNLRYFGSEPWPFPDSLMIGFVADYAGGEIRIDNNEIEAAGWFKRNELPPSPSKTSISRALIEAWIRGEI
ncbi:NAD(+) diphosphatase [Methanocalculus sp.]|uniref:NAD(+) diphosphatase n=1 Tax=Methanocalculus sp. TaxID=2004547 RepID=UPI0026148706|nr:NAD(+) diphosphatase [Methanocalculus sp.]MDG6249210.1 NAD(+) diphosphatase [Methanocalculus sp.]